MATSNDRIQGETERVLIEQLSSPFNTRIGQTATTALQILSVAVQRRLMQHEGRRLSSV